MTPPLRLLLQILVCLVFSACSAGPLIPRVPPGFLLKWDVSKAGSVVAQIFEVREYRVYRVELIFSPHTRPFDMQAMRETQAFTGDGSLKSDGHGHVSNGDSPEANGTIIPIHLIIEPMEVAGHHLDSDFVDRRIQTGGIEGARSIDSARVVQGSLPLDPLSQGGLMRLIAEAALHPGVYRLEIQTEAPTTVPQSIETILSVTQVPKTRVLRDDS